MLGAIERAFAAVLAAASAVRDFVAAEDEAALAGRDEEVAKLRAAVRDLIELTADNPMQQHGDSLDPGRNASDGGAAAQVRSDAALRGLPVVVLTSSREEADLARSYELGVNSYIVKSASFAQLLEEMAKLAYYWLVMNRTPTAAT